MSTIDVLRNELTADPLARGYAGMTDAQAAADLNDPRLTRDRKIIPAHEIVSAIVSSEWGAVSAANREAISFIVSAGDVNVQSPNVRLAFTAAFSAGVAPLTRAALVAIATEPASRAQQLGLPAIKTGWVEEARRA